MKRKKTIKEKVELVKVELGQPETMNDIFKLNKSTFVNDEVENRNGLSLWGKPNKQKR